MFIGILSGLLFGIATPFSKILLSDMNSFQLAGLLYLGSGLFTIPLLIINYFNNYFNNMKIANSKIANSFNLTNFNLINIKTFFNSTNIKIILILIFGGILGPLFLMLGLSYGTATSTSIWLNMELIATAILGYLIFKDNIDRYTIIGLILTFLAGVIISWTGGTANIISVIL
jgi:drug/metabolite transporter (DMT)-like permease